MSLAETTYDFTEATVGDGAEAIRYFEAGEGRPLVVLGGGGGVWLSRAHELLAEARRVIVLEAPGFGESAQQPDSLGSVVAAVGRALDDLGVDEFDLMGSSFGACVAAALALERPAVKALVLVAPALVLPDDWKGPSSPEELRSRLFAEGSKLEPPEVDAEAMEKMDALVESLFSADVRTALESRLPALETRTLVVFGNDDEIVPSTLGSRYVALMPDASLALVYAAGHVPEVERPEAFSDLVGDFLDKGPEFVIGTGSTLINP
jgi:pimeloyl-ACP methyl ester carboxylesterase